MTNQITKNLKVILQRIQDASAKQATNVRFYFYLKLKIIIFEIVF